MEIAHPAPKPESSASGFLSHLPDELLKAAKKIPGAAIVIEAVQMWWEQHPLRPAGVMAEQAARKIVVPMAQRSPFAFIGSAIVIGGLLVVSRPWRWLLKPALFVGLVPQVIRIVMKRYPAESLFRMASAMLQKKRASPVRPGMKPATTPKAAPPL